MLYAALQVFFFGLGLGSTVVTLVALQASRGIFAHLVRDTDSDGSDFVARVKHIKDLDKDNQRWVKLWYVLTIVSWVFVGMGRYKKRTPDDPPQDVKSK